MVSEVAYEDAKKIAQAGLEIGAIKLNSDNPFQWASGYRMPVYNDNRMFLEYPEYRELILKIFDKHLMAHDFPEFDVVAGTATAGIPWATMMAHEWDLPLIYIRDKPKSHGLKNRIEGIDADSDLGGKTIILFEDLISTGGSSVSAVEAIRSANGVCNYCLSIFNYGLGKAKRRFSGEEEYEEGHRLETPCEVISLLTYKELLRVAKETGDFTPEQLAILGEWEEDPFGWGEAHGFPRVKR